MCDVFPTFIYMVSRSSLRETYHPDSHYKTTEDDRHKKFTNATRTENKIQTYASSK